MDEETIIAILNIPRSYGSGDLRRFFTTFVESSRFKCFHYKRRPRQKLQNSVAKLLNTQKVHPIPSAVIDGSSLTNCALVKLSKRDVVDFKNAHQSQNWFGKNEIELDTECYLVELNSQLDNEVLNCMELRPPTLMPNGNVGTTTKFFLNAINSCQMPSSLISKLDLEFPSTKSRRYGNVPPPKLDAEPCAFENNITQTSQQQWPKSLKTVTGTVETYLERNRDITSNSVKSKSDYSTPASENDKYANLGEEWERHQALNDDPHSARRQLFNPDDYNYQPGTKERLFEEEQEVTWDKGSSGLVFYTDAQYWHSFKTDEERNCDDWDVDMSIYYKDSRPDLDSSQIKEMNNEHKTKNGTIQTKSVFRKRKPETFIQNKLAMKKTNDKIISKKKTNLPVLSFVKSTGCIVGESSRKLRKKEPEKFKGNEFSLKIMKQQGWKDGFGLGAKNEGIARALDGTTAGQTNRAGLGYKDN